jgi:excisionase family DNA binding protein
MTSLLTAKELQAILQVDRSTIYRMAESGRIPAVKVGRQWRFPSEQISSWLAVPGSPAPTLPPLEEVATAPDGSLSDLLPREYVDDMAELLGGLLGVMVVVTDMQGSPLAKAANPCGLFAAIDENDDAVARCVASWKKLAGGVDLQPRFTPSHMGLLCARSFIRVGSELKGMVLVGGIAPDVWPPDSNELEAIAEAFRVPMDLVENHVHEVYRLDEADRQRVLSYLPRMAQMLSHIANERTNHLTRLDAIATLVGLDATNKEHQ